MSKVLFWYLYRQNNSGGTFIKPAVVVYIQAPDADQADIAAEDYGLYFDGDGDCPTCGNRWHRAGTEDGEPELFWHNEDCVRTEVVSVLPSRDQAEPCVRYKTDFRATPWLPVEIENRFLTGKTCMSVAWREKPQYFQMLRCHKDGYIS